MKINNDMRRLLKNTGIWIAVIIIAASVWVFGFYWASRIPNKLTLRVWCGASYELNDTVKNRVEKVADGYGMKKCLINSYNPTDSQYGAAFALQANYTDVFILEKSEAETEAQAGIFKPLGDLSANFGDSELLEYNNEIIGVKFYGDYYILLSNLTNKCDELLIDVIKTLYTYGDSL